MAAHILDFLSVLILTLQGHSVQKRTDRDVLRFWLFTKIDFFFKVWERHTTYSKCVLSVNASMAWSHNCHSKGAVPRTQPAIDMGEWQLVFSSLNLRLLGRSWYRKFWKRKKRCDDTCWGQAAVALKAWKPIFLLSTEITFREKNKGRRMELRHCLQKTTNPPFPPTRHQPPQPNKHRGTRRGQ